MYPRARSPEELLPLLLKLRARFGVTRIANVTGLDVLGVPTVMVVRPNARLADVSQGKGLTLTDAKISGLMEAAECWHAENTSLDLRLATITEARRLGAIIDPERLPRVRGRSTHTLDRLLWCRGEDLLTSGAIWAPHDLVNGDLTDRRPHTGGMFPFETSGLAAGNIWEEASLAGAYEVVERDAVARFRRLSASQATACARAAADDPTLQSLLAQVSQQVGVRFWEAPTDLGAAVVICEIEDRERSSEPIPPAEGFGAAASACEAAVRALLEAIQVRLTHIVGVREDRFRDAYVVDMRARSEDSATPEIELAGGPRVFASARAELDWLLSQMRQAGIDQVAAVKLSASELPIRVVKIVIPGLEASHDDYERDQVGWVDPQRVSALAKVDR